MPVTLIDILDSIRLNNWRQPKRYAMQIDWLMVIGLVLIVEGMMPLLFPATWRNYVRKLAEEPLSGIRVVGGILFFLGIVLLSFR